MVVSGKSSDMKDRLIQRYGPLIGGTDLRNILGYKAASTFNRAKRLNLIDIHLFQIPNRRGNYALTTDVADWLERVSKREG